MDRIRKLLCCLLALTLSLQMSAAAYSSAAFQDVDESSPWYEGVCYAYEQGIVDGIGSNLFAPDSLLTVQQWATMLCRALENPLEVDSGKTVVERCYAKGWISVNALLEPDMTFCRGALYQSAFCAAGLDIYSYELYPNGTTLSSWDNCLRVAQELGICSSEAVVQEQVTRGEAVQLLYLLMTQDLSVTVPPILVKLTIQNDNELHLDPYLLVLHQIPESILSKFQDLGWKIVLDCEYLDELSDALGFACSGATNYQQKTIYLSEAGAVLHEMGHFVNSAIHFPYEVRKLYGLEAEAAAKVLGNYSTTNSQEYFAEYFAYWVSFRGNNRKMAALEKASPNTYLYFTELEANDWRP